MVIHEPASTKAHDAEDNPAVDPTATEDIGPHDNVEDDEVLPQIEQFGIIAYAHALRAHQHWSSSDANCSGCIVG